MNQDLFFMWWEFEEVETYLKLYPHLWMESPDTPYLWIRSEAEQIDPEQPVLFAIQFLPPPGIPIKFARYGVRVVGMKWSSEASLHYFMDHFCKGLAIHDRMEAAEIIHDEMHVPLETAVNLSIIMAHVFNVGPVLDTIARPLYNFNACSRAGRLFRLRREIEDADDSGIRRPSNQAPGGDHGETERNPVVHELPPPVRVGTDPEPGTGSTELRPGIRECDPLVPPGTETRSGTLGSDVPGPAAPDEELPEGSSPR